MKIELPNIDQLSEFLVRHIDSIQPLIIVCQEIKKNISEAIKIKLVYEIENEDCSGAENITLYVQIDKDFFEVDKKLDLIVSPYDDYFIDSGVLFTAQVSRVI
ncbi:MAG: hypothetical protein AABZ74_00370 [Cyanobacteriota bacterium]